MQRHTLRNLLIAAALVVALIYIYPTIGWMTLSDDQRQARLAKWNEEDSVYEQKGFFAETGDAVRRWAEFDRSMVINLGLDLQGGIHMILGLDFDALPDDYIERMRSEGGFQSEEAIHEHLQQTVLRRIERRLSEFEAREPVIQTMGDSQIQVQLPGEKDINRAKNLITRTAYLTFHMAAGPQETGRILGAINQEFPGRFLDFFDQPRPGDPFYRIPAESVDQVRAVLEEARAMDDLIPEDKMILLSQPPAPWDQPYYEIYVLNKEPDLSGEGLTMAVARPDQQTGAGNWMVLFENNAQSAADFQRVTAENINRNMAIVVDDVVVSAPTIQGPIGANGQVTGQFSQEQAQDLAIALNSGSLPVPIREDFTGVVGASLGAQSVRQGVTAAIAGVAVTMVFMMIYYLLPGIIANVALVCNAILLLAMLAYFNSTLTLPGIAGLILTVGMAVDANVLIFERIREELRNGKSVKASVESGFQKATSSILDANVTTLIAAAILLQFGTGPIESFAITLSIGVVTSVFSALVISRSVFDFIVERNLVKHIRMFSVIRPDTKIPFMSYRRPGYIFTSILMVAGIAVFAMRGNDNFGVDFTTGTNMIVHLTTDEPIPVEDVRAKLADKGLTDVRAQRMDADTEANKFSIHLGEVAAATEGESISTNAQLALAELLTTDPTPATAGEYVVLDRVDSVGPTVGAQLKWDALRAILVSFFFIIIYLWFRFEYKFAIAAIVATIHDVIIVVGLLAIFQQELSLSVVAALLTIIGYSLNDTIIVFDRIREDLQVYRGRELSFQQILDLSVNHTLSRTILTSGTTLFVVMVLFIFGGTAIRDFSLTLVLGIIVGTFSSIFVANPIVNYLNGWEQKRRLAMGQEEKGSRRRGKKKKDLEKPVSA
jgi:SecD/SecF fusion protein